jgi:hypothetical protein
MVKSIIASKATFDWKQERLVGVIDTLVEQASEGNCRNIGVIVTAIKTLNDMSGHNAPVSTINIEVGEDQYIKRLNTVTLELIKEKREHKLIEVSHDRT